MKKPISQRRKPAFRKALAYLVENRIEKSGHNLRTLADAADVSYVTMWAAFRHYRAAGHAGGVEKTADTAAATRPAPRLPRAQSLAARLANDIMNGTFTPGAVFPSCKQMAAHYAVGNRTLAEALSAVEADGMIERHKKGYRVSVMGSTDSTGAAIILSACGTTSGLLAAYTPRTRQMVRLLEAECFSRNIRLIQVYTSVSGHDLDIPRYCDRVRRELSSNKTVIGIMALRIGFTETGFADLLDRYAKMNVPVAVLDDGEHPAAMPAYRPAWEKAPLAVFSLAVGPACTRLVVDHLFALGHRSFAYLSPFHTEQWSRDRLEGIGAQCGRLGRGARVEPFTEAVPFVNAEWREILKEAAGCGPAYADQVEFYEYTLVAALRNRRFVEPVLRLAGEALRSAAATAWIGANDFSAVVATSALDSAASSRARHISVAGFDDSDEAFLHGITSHNFNVQGMVNAALRHVLNPRLRPSRGKPARQVTIDGYLAVRSSTGRP